MIEMTAPVKKAIYSATIVFVYPSNRPNGKENLTSPKPIPAPLVARNKIRKNKRDKIPAIIF